MDKDLILDGSFASVSTGAHPGLRTAKIIYLDDQPNENGFGVEYEDFEDIKKTIIGTPLKMRFLGDDVSGHKGSIPIGFINNVAEAESNGVHQLVIDATLFAEDYPDEVEWLETRYKEGKAPGVSFEITYHESILKNGVNWIKGLVARAATFVRSPAYGSRTALLALASDKDISAEDFMKELSALANEVSPKIPVKGGNIRMEEELERIKAELAALKETLNDKEKEIETLSAEKDALATEKGELETSLAEKDEVISGYVQKETLTARQAILAEAGITVEVKPERITKMDDEQFTEYVADLKAVAEAAKKETTPVKKLVSERNPRLPRFNPDDSAEKPSASELAGRFKNYSRSTASEDTE